MPARPRPPAGRTPVLRRLATAPGGRRAKWLVLAAWLILVAALGPLAGKLGEVEDSSSNAFLPGSAESAQVNTELEKFRGEDEIIPAVCRLLPRVRHHPGRRRRGPRRPRRLRSAGGPRRADRRAGTVRGRQGADAGGAALHRRGRRHR